MTPEPKRFTLSRAERLGNHQVISNLFEKGTTLSSKGFIIKYLVAQQTELASEFPVRICFVVPKKTFRKAVIRNKIRRLMKEQYRIQKHLLYDSCKNKSITLSLLILYKMKTVISYQEMGEFITEGLTELVKKFEKV